MSLWFKLCASFKAVICIAVACGILLLPAPMAHATNPSTVTDSDPAMVMTHPAVDHQHDAVSFAHMHDMADSATSGEGHDHDDAKCCSGMCLPVAMIETQPQTQSDKTGARNGVTPAQLVSVEVSETLRPPLT